MDYFIYIAIVMHADQDVDAKFVIVMQNYC